MAVSMMADSSAGKAKAKSLARMMSSSHPAAPAPPPGSPARTPSPRPMPTAITPTTMEFCAPTRMLRGDVAPRLSVPSQCAAEGGCSLAGMSISAGG
jgi:hypothetical protein